MGASEAEQRSVSGSGGLVGWNSQGNGRVRGPQQSPTAAVPVTTTTTTATSADDDDAWSDSDCASCSGSVFESKACTASYFELPNRIRCALVEDKEPAAAAAAAAAAASAASEDGSQSQWQASPTASPPSALHPSRPQPPHHSARPPPRSEAMVHVSVCVGAGRLSDPQAVQGLAQLAERMAVLGSLSFPEEDGLRTLVEAGGGALQTEVADEHTALELDVRLGSLPLAVRMVGDLLTRPLLPLPRVAREVAAVRAAHTQRVGDDGFRTSQLLRDLANPEHPLSSLGTGGADTLGTQPEAQLREQAASWLATHVHGANVAVVASVPAAAAAGEGPVLTLDELEAILLEGLSVVRRESFSQQQKAQEVAARKRAVGGSAGAASIAHSCDESLEGSKRGSAQLLSPSLMATSPQMQLPAWDCVESDRQSAADLPSFAAANDKDAKTGGESAAAAAGGAAATAAAEQEADQARAVATECFLPDMLPMLVRVPTRDADPPPPSVLKFVFPVEGVGLVHYEGWSVRMASYYLGSGAEGGMVHTLLQSGLVQKAEAGVERQGRRWTLLAVNLTLAPPGEADIEAVFVLLVRGVAMLREALLESAWEHWEGLRRIVNLQGSLYPDQMRPARSAVSLLYVSRPEHFLLSDRAFLDFKGAEMQRIASKLDPRHMVVLHLSSHHLPADLQHSALWGDGTRYGVMKVDDELVRIWEGGGSSPAAAAAAAALQPPPFPVESWIPPETVVPPATVSVVRRRGGQREVVAAAAAAALPYDLVKYPITSNPSPPMLVTYLQTATVAPGGGGGAAWEELEDRGGVEGVCRVTMCFPSCLTSFVFSAALYMFVQLLQEELRGFTQQATQHGVTFLLRVARGSQARIEIVCQGVASILPAFIDSAFHRIEGVVRNWCRPAPGSDGGALNIEEYFVKCRASAATHVLLTSTFPEDPVVNARLQNRHLLCGESPHDPSTLIQGLSDLSFADLKAFLPTCLLCPALIDVGICGPPARIVHARSISSFLHSFFFASLLELSLGLAESPFATSAQHVVTSPVFGHPRTQLVPPAAAAAAVATAASAALPRSAARVASSGSGGLGARANGGGVAALARSAPARQPAHYLHTPRQPQESEGQAPSVAVVELCYLPLPDMTAEDQCAATRILTECLRLSLESAALASNISVGADYASYDSCTTCVLYASSPIFPCGDLLCFLRVFVDAFVRRAAEAPGYAGINGVVLREAVSQACAVASRGSDSTWEREGGVAERATEWGSMYDRCVAADLQGFASVRRVRVAGELATLSATSGGIAAAAAAVSRLALALSYTMSTVNTDAARFGSIFQDCSYPRQTQYLGDNAHGVTRITFPAPTRGSLAHAAALDLRGPLPPLAFNLVLSPSAFIAHSTLCTPVRTADHSGGAEDDEHGGGASALDSSLVSPREGE
eukprot:Rhum_TRINITY_DN15333_c18_g1::Rhum_TRINITY_DN15333_c18_g1_i1::g.152520::m.152520